LPNDAPSNSKADAAVEARRNRRVWPYRQWDRASLGELRLAIGRRRRQFPG
jgi:hypothetical protein